MKEFWHKELKTPEDIRDLHSRLFSASDHFTLNATQAINIVLEELYNLSVRMRQNE